MTIGSGDSGLALRLLAPGKDRNPRFTLANERSSLAWVRTSLALTAACVGLETFTSGIIPSRLRQACSVVLLLCGSAA